MNMKVKDFSVFIIMNHIMITFDNQEIIYLIKLIL